MNNSKKSNEETSSPIILLMAKQVDEPKVSGVYSNLTDSWSNRIFEATSSKKHCESM